MACNCEYKHTSTALSAAGLLTVSNNTNIGDLEKFCIVLTINPDEVITTAPVAYTISINGNDVPIWDIWGIPITTDVLKTRCLYKGRYVAEGTPHLTLRNVLSNEAEAALLAEKTGG